VLSDDRLLAEGLVRLVAAEGTLIAPHCEDRPPLTKALRDSDVLLVDSRLEGALALAGDLRGRRPALIFVSGEDDNDWTVRALAAGARGVFGKAAPPEQLAKAIRVVHEGELWASRRLVAAALEHLAAMARPTPFGAPAWEQRLSAREREVMQRAARGLTNRQLARRLAISGATVKAHLNRIFQKLGVHNRAELAAVCLGLKSPKTRAGAFSRSSSGQYLEPGSVRSKPSTVRPTPNSRSPSRRNSRSAD